MSLLPWAWLLPLPGLLLTAVGVGRRPGVASQAGPPLLFLAALAGLASGGTSAVRVSGWIPFLPDGTLYLRADPLALAMLAVVGGVSTAIYVYSLAYMDGDPGQRRFFAYLDFFVASMALLVLAGNLTVLLIGWTGVGIASFLLISFWRDRPGTLRAGLEALAANAVGDAALLLAVVLVPAGCGDLANLQAPACTVVPGGAGLLATLLVIAAMAKSAQGPLYFWLPSAMAGPTPVSALIHAATMVAAGVYLLVRASALLALAPGVLLATAIIGVATALFGGLASLQQSNFKRGLAYSTVSQLGYMFAGIGLGVPFAAFFHLVTHASFKALLFLSAGVVIHATGGEEELSRLGGLRKVLPAAYAAFLVGSLALIGLPLTAGAFSKDLLIEAGLEHNPVLGVLLLAGALLTGLYIGRLFFGVFHGPNPNAEPQALAHAASTEESAPVTHHSSLGTHHVSGLLTWPLLPLALGAILLGYLNWPSGGLSALLAPALGEAPASHIISPIGLAAGGLGVIGMLLAGWWRQRARVAPAKQPGRAGWVDVVAAAGYRMAQGVAAVHSGQLARYAFVTFVGVAVILFLGLNP